MRYWKYEIEFIAIHEKSFSDGDLDLFEMCKVIYDDFYKYKWVNDYEKKIDCNKTFIEEEEIAALEEIIDSLHTIAYAEDIFGKGEELPDVDDYDYFKNELYDWCDINSVWLSPKLY